MRRVILSDSWNDFIKVIIAERKHSTYKPPTPSAPHSRNLLMVVFGKKGHISCKSALGNTLILARYIM